MNLVMKLAVFALLALASLPTATAAEVSPTQKPPQLDDQEWASLQQAVRRSVGQSTRLVGDPSGAGADGEPDDQFGFSVALDGSTALIGAHLDDVGNNVDQGSAYVFTLNGGEWVQEAKLVALDGDASSFFGLSVALDGDTALIGARFPEPDGNNRLGLAYVFTRIGNTWYQQQKLTSAFVQAFVRNGTAVALEGNTALVGVRHEQVGLNVEQGAAYVFTRSSGIWFQQARLTAADGSAAEEFGRSVALDGNTAVVGAWLANVGGASGRGSAYVFVRGTDAWTQQAKLTASDGAELDRFGYVVALDGDTALIGAPHRAEGSNFDQGSAYVFTRVGTAWTQQAKLSAANGAAGMLFGSAVALSGDLAVVGAPLADVGVGVRQGSAYVFSRVGTGWTHQALLSTGSNGAIGNAFASSVALSEGTLLAGGPVEGLDGDSPQGSAYIFTSQGEAWTKQQELTSGVSVALKGFGIALALQGDTALVTASSSALGVGNDDPVVYVFSRDGASWILQARLMSPEAAAQDRFGEALALHGDVALVGAPGATIEDDLNRGAVYVFVRNQAAWTQHARLIAKDGATADSFGNSVDMSADSAIVGAALSDVGGNSNQGAAYIFVRDGNTWLEQGRLLAGDGAANEWFGLSVGIHGDTALVGAGEANVDATPGRGAAYVFVRSGSTWSEQSKLTPDFGVDGRGFGRSVDIESDTALISAPLEQIEADVRGAAYVFARGGTTWSKQAKLVPADGATYDQFGASLALSGDAALIGAPTVQRSVYLFNRQGTSWTQQGKLVDENGELEGLFGYAVALSGSVALVGAPSSGGLLPYGNPREGAAYVLVGLGGLFADGFESQTTLAQDMAN